MKLYYSDTFAPSLPPGHRFPVSKSALLRRRLGAGGAFRAEDFRIPAAATDAELSHAHAGEYIARVAGNRLSRDELRRIGFPWSLPLVERARRSAGATVAACRDALAEGCAANLSGGTHHAFRDRGEGFCIFNDAALATLLLLAEGRVRRVAIVDCDVHQGNGTASILRGVAGAFTCSLHGANNFPFEKEPSDLDVELPDGAGDAVYLGALESALGRVLAAGPFDLAIYLAGADPYAGDRLGRLALSKPGLLARDRMVLDAFFGAGTPVALAMAGGYARAIEDTVDIHCATLELARTYWRNRPAAHQ